MAVLPGFTVSQLGTLVLFHKIHQQSAGKPKLRHMAEEGSGNELGQAKPRDTGPGTGTLGLHHSIGQSKLQGPVRFQWQGEETLPPMQGAVLHTHIRAWARGD